MNKNKIDKDILIEDLVDNFPFSVKFLADNGIRCIVCGEAIWGTLEEACKEKDFDDSVIEGFVYELNKLNRNFEDRVEDNFMKINVDKMNE